MKKIHLHKSYIKYLRRYVSRLNKEFINSIEGGIKNSLIVLKEE
jgi:hypothetical protein